MLDVLAKVFAERTKTDRSFYISPSNLGRCGRELLLSLLGLYSFQPKGFVREILQSGVLYEDRTMDILESAGVNIIARQAPVFVPVLFESELLRASPVCSECGLSAEGSFLHGHIDAIAENEDRTTVLEHKAVGEWMYKRAVEHAARADFSSLYSHFREYFVQAGIYLVGLLQGRTFYVEGAETKKLPVQDPYAVILVRNRNRPEFLSLTLEYDVDEDILFCKGGEVLRESNLSAFKLNGQISGFMAAVERKLALLSEFRKALSALSEVDSNKTDVARFLARHPEIFSIVERAAQKFAERTDRCGWCEAREMCKAVFGEKNRKPEREVSSRKRVFLIQKKEDKDLVRKILRLEEKKKALEEEIKDLKEKVLATLENQSADIMILPSARVLVERVRREGGLSVSAKKLPADVLDYIKEVAPEAVYEREPTVYTRITKVSEQGLRRWLAGLQKQEKCQEENHEVSVSNKP